MELSNEDNLRLNVLLRQDLKAVRVDESRMIVYGLTNKGEAKIQLNPTCKEEQYLRLVREVFSTYILGSPGGYPVYIRRWTRMGQARDEDSLENLLLLGEPEAVTAVVHAPELSPEIAANAWWAYPSAENARQLLATPRIAASDLGPELAQYLLEFLPFEAEAQAQIDSIRLILQPGLIDSETTNKLWKNARRKQNYYIGFLHALPHTLPDPEPPHPLLATYEAALTDTAKHDPCARLLLQVMTPQGQRFLKTVEGVINKAATQEAVVELMNAIGNYFAELRPDQQHYREIVTLTDRAQQADVAACIAPILKAAPELEAQVRAMISLSLIDEYIVAEVFGHTDAMGTVMRRRLEPVTLPLLSVMRTLNPSIAVK